MDDSAGKIHQQQDGGSNVSPNSPDHAHKQIDPGAALKSSDHLDQWRIHLVDLVYLFNATFRDALYWEGVKAEKDTFHQFIKVLAELDRLPEHDGVIRITHRGSTSTKAPEKIDYLIQFGEVSLDLPTIAGIIKRMGIRVKHLEGRVTQSFRTLAVQGIKTLDIKMPGADRQSLGQLKTALQIIAGYNHAIEKETRVKFNLDGRPASVDLVVNDAGEPDPNLTILAALNNLNPSGAQDLVNKILALRKNPKIAASGLMGLSVYQTIFAVKALREQLVRSPIEVNANLMPAVGTGSGGGGSGGGAGSSDSGGSGGSGGGRAVGAPQPIMGQVASKAEIASYVMETYGASPDNAAEVMKSIYSADYRQIDSKSIGSRLATLTDMLSRLDQSEKGQKVMDAITRQIQTSFDQVSVDMLDDLFVQENEVRIWDGDAVKSVGKVDGQLADIIETTKTRSAVKRKTQAIVNWEEGFKEEDYELLATKYGVPRNTAEDICQVFKSCFDAKGNFQRQAFEQQIPEFAEHPQKVFEILWEFLKITSRRSDRLPFLNSFQLLNERIQQPINLIRFLLSDFINDPEVVSFSDRNAMMLVIQFLRTYNKERHMDIEITPEEVLLVKVGLDRKVANYAAWKIDADHEKTLTKIVTIRKRLIDALESGSQMASGMAFRFLLALEREVHMFLGLSGGKTAAKVIRGSLNVYGDPESEVFRIHGSHLHVPALMQHLSVLIRSLARLGGPEDIIVLNEIKKRQRSFAMLEDTPRHRAMVRRVLGWSDPAIRAIESRKAAEQKAPTEIQLDLPE